MNALLLILHLIPISTPPSIDRNSAMGGYVRDIYLLAESIRQFLVFPDVPDLSNLPCTALLCKMILRKYRRKRVI